MRRVASSEEFFDILDRIGNGKFVTIGYVTGANLNVPTIKSSRIYGRRFGLEFVL